MSWLSQTWEMKWFSSIGKSWSCTIKSEFCPMHLVERDIIGDLFGWKRFQWQNYSVQDFLVMGNPNPANGDFGISESGVSWKHWKDFNKNRELVILVKPNNRFADKKVLCSVPSVVLMSTTNTGRQNGLWRQEKIFRIHIVMPRKSSLVSSGTKCKP